MTLAWILVANASLARLYAIPKAKLFNGSCKLSLVKEFMHPESRLKTAELTSDISGNQNFVESGDPKDQEAERFAKELADALETGRVSHKYEELIISAPPQFHGTLKKYINDKIQHLISVDIKKDYTKDNSKALVAHLQSYV